MTYSYVSGRFSGTGRKSDKVRKYPDLKDAIGESTYDQIQQYLGYLNMVPVVPVLKLSLFVRLF